MRTRRFTITAAAVPLALAIGTPTAHAVDEDGPIFAPPHGMLLVELDQDTNKLFATDGAAGLGGQTATNASGQTILFNALTPSDPDLEDDFNPIGGIAERTFFDPTKAFHEQVQAAMDAGVSQPFPVATRDDVASTPPVFVADDPGFFTQIDDSNNTAVPSGTQISVNFHGPLLYYNPVTDEWTTPPNGEQLRVFDLDEVEGLAFREQDPIFLNATSSGLVGTLIQGTVEDDLDTGGLDPSHGHLGYELSIPDSTDAPARGAYMIEITLSGLDVSGGTDGAAVGFEDSDPIMFMWKSDLPASIFGNAVDAAVALPEPSTAAVVALVSGGLIVMRRRNANA